MLSTCSSGTMPLLTCKKTSSLFAVCVCCLGNTPVEAITRALNGVAIQRKYSTAHRSVLLQGSTVNVRCETLASHMLLNLFNTATSLARRSFEFDSL